MLRELSGNLEGKGIWVFFFPRDYVEDKICSQAACEEGCAAEGTVPGFPGPGKRELRVGLGWGYSLSLPSRCCCGQGGVGSAAKWGQKCLVWVP